MALEMEIDFSVRRTPETEMAFSAFKALGTKMDCSVRMTVDMEMDFSKHRSLQLDWVEMDLSMAAPRISVEWVKVTAVVITPTLIMSQTSIGICPMITPIEESLHVHVHNHLLLPMGIQQFPHRVMIIARASRQRGDNTSTIANHSTVRITLSAGKLQLLPRSLFHGHHH